MSICRPQGGVALSLPFGKLPSTSLRTGRAGFHCLIVWRPLYGGSLWDG